MSILAKRGTTAQINAAAGANGLKASELIYNTDTAALMVATSKGAAKAVADASLANVSQSDVRAKVGTGTMAYRDFYYGPTPPGGTLASGTVWFETET